MPRLPASRRGQPLRGLPVIFFAKNDGKGAFVGRGAAHKRLNQAQVQPPPHPLPPPLQPQKPKCSPFPLCGLWAPPAPPFSFRPPVLSARKRGYLKPFPPPPFQSERQGGTRHIPAGGKSTRPRSTPCLTLGPERGKVLTLEFLGFWGVSPCAPRPIIATHKGLGADRRHPPCEGRERSAFFRSRPSCGGVPKKRKKDGRKP